MPSVMTDLMSLIENHIPEGRESLEDSHANLEKVAEYCEANYFQAENKRSALEETKLFTTQSLASVAYQINTVAYHLLQMLDLLQNNVLAQMESEINHISQTVSIHKEKIARREIGILTTTKNTSRQHKILAPSLQERPIKYIRKPVDYNILDDIGHGVKTSNTPRSKHTMALMQNPLNGNPAACGPAPTTKPPTPPQPIRACGSLSRGAKEYRALAPPIAPPQVPSNYAPNYPVGHPRSSHDVRRGSGYSTLPMLSTSLHSTQPQIGMVHPMAQTQHSNVLGPSSPIPPPPLGLGNKSLEPVEPLMHVAPDYPHPPGNISPPLPPPPEDDDMHHENFHPPSPPPFLRSRKEPDWVPKNYVEKVIAIYDYCADKEDELSFSENSIIYVLKKNDDGWYEGVMDGFTGLFPGNYVEPM